MTDADRKSMEDGTTLPLPGSEPQRAKFEALDNSQSLLVMIAHLGDGRSAMGFKYPSGITPAEWDDEGLTKLLEEQISENRAALQPPSSPPKASDAPGAGKCVEPVAWRWRDWGDSRWTLSSDAPHDGWDEVQPLYAAPPQQSIPSPVPDSGRKM